MIISLQTLTDLEYLFNELSHCQCTFDNHKGLQSQLQYLLLKTLAVVLYPTLNMIK
jgi:hypothetical protein